MNRYDYLLAQLAEGTSHCLLWPFPLTSAGYGQVQHNGHRDTVHRVAYAYKYGPIPEGLQVDHLCNTRSCFNPEHLEAVTQQENVARGLAGYANNANAAKTHCPAGHKYTEENTQYSKEGHRRCKICTR